MISKEEWTQLDKLLGKCGFGGYYDFIECIKMSIEDLNSKLKLFKGEKIREETDLQLLIKLLLALTKEVRIT